MGRNPHLKASLKKSSDQIHLLLLCRLMNTMATGGRLRELMKKYGKVAVGVHLSISAASITGLYIAIKNNVDVESMLEKVGLPGIGRPETPEPQDSKERVYSDDFIIEEQPVVTPKEKNRTAELAASTGGAVALAILLNKALFPVRVPITLALTPPSQDFLLGGTSLKTMYEQVISPIEEKSSLLYT